MAKKPTRQNHTWEITLIRERGRLLGHVETPDEETAIEEAIKQFRDQEPRAAEAPVARRED